MPELPDVEVWREALDARLAGATLERVRLVSPFLLRTVEPPLADAEGRAVVGVERLGKRVVIELAGELFLVLHPMIAGRLRWRPAPEDAGGGAVARPTVPGRIGLAALDFTSGTLLVTEASKKKRASLHVVPGRAGLSAHDRGGLEPLDATLEDFAAALARENHTVKRALCDARLFSGIGNAYSDEILHAARLSPLVWTERLGAEEVERLWRATREVLKDWRDRLRREAGDGFPEKVTAFREEMAVHGRFGEPCPACGSKVQRIVYAERETNYCARCQTGGKLLADRALSRLLKDDWPKRIEELEGD